MRRRDFIKYAAALYSLFNINLSANGVSKTKKRKITTPKFCLMGIGGGGTNIVDELLTIDSRNIYIQINSDYDSLKRKHSKNKILLGQSKLAGLGCGGNIKCGESLISNKIKNQIKQLTKEMNTIYIATTLGGGLGSGSTPEILQYLRGIEKKVIVFVTMPFAFEGKKRTENAYNALEKIKLYTDHVVIIENDNLLKYAKSKGLGIFETLKLPSENIYKRIILDDYAGVNT